MKIIAQNKAIYQRLYAAAEKIKAAAPWNYMRDSYMWAVEHPQTGETNYCIILGAIGEVFAFVMYEGEEGWRSFENLAELGAGGHELDGLNAMISQQLLKVEFVPTDELKKADKAALRTLGLKSGRDGKNIQIRKMSPGYAAWFLDEEDTERAEFLAFAMEQSLHVFEKVRKAGREVLFDKAGNILTLTEGKNGETEEKYCEEPQMSVAEHRPNKFLVNKIKKGLKMYDTVLFVTVFYLPSMVQEEKDAVPFHPLMMVCMEGQEGNIIYSEVITPDKNNPEGFDAAIVKLLETVGGYPKMFVYNTDKTHEVFSPLCEALEIKIVADPENEKFGVCEYMMRLQP